MSKTELGGRGPQDTIVSRVMGGHNIHAQAPMNSREVSY